MRYMLTFVVLALAIAQLSSAAPLWGNDGHRIVGQIAQNLISSSTADSCSNILSGQTLQDVATWADQVKHEAGWGWSAALHYINTPDWSCNYVHSRDCGDNRCVAGAIANYSSRIMTQTDPEQVDEALKFLVHFVGDIHQPLHVGFTSDAGGNDIHGTYNGHSTNLHAVWDYEIIDQRLEDFNNDDSQYAGYLLSQIQGPWSQNATIWAQCNNYTCEDTWGTESAALACSYAYVNPDGSHIQTPFSLGNDYYNFALPIVELQLSRAGVRLAAALNKIFSNSSPAEALVAAVASLPSNSMKLEALPKLVRRV